MQIHIHHPHLKSNDEAIQEAVEHALGRFDSRLTRVEVFIKDINGDKGGDDKHCTIEARPRGMDPMAAEHEAGSILVAVTAAADKLKTQLSRHFGKLDHH